jgi:hypothetical protein
MRDMRDMRRSRAAALRRVELVAVVGLRCDLVGGPPPFEAQGKQKVIPMVATKEKSKP